MLQRVIMTHRPIPLDIAITLIPVTIVKGSASMIPITTEYAMNLK